MTRDVKRETRVYDNRNRSAQARRTRRRVVDAARRLFVRDGYAATTIQALADEAGVAVQTVYAAFGSKLEVLRQLFDISIAGDDADVALADRPEWRAWQSEQHVDNVLASFAKANLAVCERTADVVGVVGEAAGSHPEIARIWEQAEAGRYEDQRTLTDHLAHHELLRPDLTRQQAADIVWTLAGPGPYTDLVRRRGWRGSEYEQWLTQQLHCALCRK